jgi:heptosyltransferase-3
MHDALLIHAGALGDFLLSMRIVASLRAAGARRVTVLGRASFVRLAVQDDLVNEVWDIDTGGWHALFSIEPGDWPDALAARLSRFDTAVNMLSGPEGAVASRLRRAGVPRIYCVDPRHRPSWEAHITEQWLADLAAQGFHGRAETPSLAVSKFKRAAAVSRMKHESRNESGRPVLLHPGSGSVDKCWPADSFIAVTRALRQAGRRPLFLLGPVERERMDPETLTAFQSAAETITTDSLEDLAVMLSDGELYIGNDSGITHLAAAVGSLTVAIFGATLPRVWAPRGEGVRVVGEQGRWPDAAQVLGVVRVILRGRDD